MKASLVVTGGFTGIPGKWEVDATTDEKKTALASDDLQEFEKLVAQAEAEKVFGEDYAAKSSGAIGPMAATADGQTYELTVNGKTVKWAEPSPSGAGVAPNVVKELKRWITRNCKRAPFRPK